MSDFHLPCFLNNLSFTPRLAVAKAPLDRKLWSPKFLESKPILARKSRTWPLMVVYLRGLSIFLGFWTVLVFSIPLKIYSSHWLSIPAKTKYLLVRSNRNKFELSFAKWSQCHFLSMSVLLFSMNIDIWALCIMKSLRFKLDTSLNLGKPMKERTSIIISLEFVRFISTPPWYWKALFRSELERGLLRFSV